MERIVKTAAMATASERELNEFLAHEVCNPLVYAAEYALQSGTWSAIGFPLDDIEARDRFFEYSNWMYQLGVFLSRLVLRPFPCKKDALESELIRIKQSSVAPLSLLADAAAGKTTRQLNRHTIRKDNAKLD
jgi:hypothetical protein